MGHQRVSKVSFCVHTCVQNGRQVDVHISASIHAYRVGDKLMCTFLRPYMYTGWATSWCAHFCVHTCIQSGRQVDVHISASIHLYRVATSWCTPYRNRIDRKSHWIHSICGYGKSFTWPPTDMWQRSDMSADVCYVLHFAVVATVQHPFCIGAQGLFYHSVQ
jgi:hypothetical protein